MEVWEVSIQCSVKVRSSSYHLCVPQWSNLPRKSIFPIAFKKLKRFQQALKTGHWTGLSTPAGVLQPKAEEVIKMGINASFTLPRFYWLQWEHLYAKSRNRWHPSDPENVSKKSLVTQRRSIPWLSSQFRDTWYPQVCCKIPHQSKIYQGSWPHPAWNGW